MKAVSDRRLEIANLKSPISNFQSPIPTRTRSDAPFIVSLVILGGVYVLLIVAMVLAEAYHTTWGGIAAVLRSPSLRYAIWLSLVSCTITTILCLWVGVPLAYLMSRWEPSGRASRSAKLIVDGIIDIPIVLPPLVVGLCLLILFQTKPLLKLQEIVPVTYRTPSIIIAQFTVSCAFAVRALRVTFDGLGVRREQVALTLGCSRSQAFWRVTLPEARRGLLTAATLAWARALGEFGPILVFSGATRFRTEVLSTSVFLHLSIGDLGGAVAVSLLMVLAAVAVMVLMRAAGGEGLFEQSRPQGAQGGRA